MEGTLYLVATPIGNLADISLRALETLRRADLIACEDTRHSRKLLTHYEITGKLVSFHQHNEHERSLELIKALKAGSDVALISDAGTPGISDPGEGLVSSAIKAGIRVVAIPGPTAFVNAVIVSGLPADSIFFGGFLPSKRSDRRKRLSEVRDIPATLVFYEAPHRLTASLADCLAELGPRRAAVVRELTKIHEEALRGTLSELAERISNAKIKGEIVLVIDRGGKAPAQPVQATLTERVAELEKSGMERRAALKTAAKEFGLSRSEAYRRLHLSE
ncbi:MAG: 16S rRNA (cytidine(1402)-2'-O)-methyltransferase [Chloracidobacterium sp.]|nr:16S rRNA (cytidine(1402)-2'-O)-methyltransferase [Chloracidobacterium sp.]